ncbi:hypothetical protein BSKO_10727 [Bryopsis sp. KO-2023]|nr:hypothetical protein BSKO_10727 [Bryopsis sp. KO-2023]
MSHLGILPREEVTPEKGPLSFVISDYCLIHLDLPWSNKRSTTLRGCETVPAQNPQVKNGILDTLIILNEMAKHLMLTGMPGVGKSTLVKVVLQQLRKDHDISSVATGFYTEEVRGEHGRIGFDVVTLAGGRAPLARLRNASTVGPTVGRYAVDLASFEHIALPELIPGGQTKMIVIDEIGKMELFSQHFITAVSSALDSGLLVFGVIPVKANNLLVPMIKNRPDVKLITLTKENRDAAVTPVLADLQKMLAQV